MTILLDELQHGKSQPPSALTESCTRESRAGDPVVALTMLLEHFLDGAYAGANLAAAFDVIELETLDLPAVRAALAACIPPAEGQIRP